MLEAHPASQCNRVDGDGTQLHRAVEAADAGALKLLLARRSLTQSTVDAADRWGRSALHAAAARGSDAMCAALLKRRASPLVKDADGSTPLHRAAAAGHTAAVRVLVAAAPMAEVQLIYRPYVDYGRKLSHLPYKVARCEEPSELARDAGGKRVQGEERRRAVAKVCGGIVEELLALRA